MKHIIYKCIPLSLLVLFLYLTCFNILNAQSNCNLIQNGDFEGYNPNETVASFDNYFDHWTDISGTADVYSESNNLLGNLHDVPSIYLNFGSNCETWNSTVSQIIIISLALMLVQVADWINENGAKSFVATACSRAVFH